jgi:hypothetical protein
LFKEMLGDAIEYRDRTTEIQREDFEFFSGQQWNSEDMSALQEENRAALTFDRTRPLILSVSGSQITSRYLAQYLPRNSALEEPDRQIASAATTVGKWVQQRADFEQMESLAFTDSLVGGYGCLEMSMEYDSDPDGMIVLSRVLPWQVVWDPASNQPNNVDRRYDIRDRWVDEDEVISMFGRKNLEEILASADTSGGIENPGVGEAGSTTRTTEQRYAYDLFRGEEKDEEHYDARTRRVRLYECQRFERRYRTRIIAVDIEDPEAVIQSIKAGQPPPMVDMMVPVDDAKEEIDRLHAGAVDINRAVVGQAEGPVPEPITIEDFPVRIYTRSYHTKHEMLRVKEIPTGGFTREYLTCHEDWQFRTQRHWMGLMRQMKDPQRYTNKFLSQAVHLFSANPKGALMFEEDLFSDTSEAAKNFNKATGFLPVKKGKLTNAPKPPWVQLTTNVGLGGIESLLAYAQQSVASSVGLSESYFVGGAQDLRRTSGKVLSSVLSQNMKTQSAPFDSLRLYRKRMGRMILDFLDAYGDPEQVARVLPQDEQEFIALMKGGNLSEEYDIVVEEVPTSPNERQEVFDVLMESGFLPQMMSQGVPIPPSLAEFFPIPADASAELKQALQSAYDLQLANMQMQMQQLAMQAQQPQPMNPGEAGPNGSPPPPGGEIQ